MLPARPKVTQLTFRESTFACSLSLDMGLPNNLIANELGIAVSTVKVQLGRVFEKFTVQERTSAATITLARGLVGLDSLE